VADIATDPFWAAFKDLALKAGVRACWSVPFVDIHSEKVLGTFAIYYRHPRGPGEAERTLIRRAAKTAQLLVVRHRQLQKQINGSPKTSPSPPKIVQDL
jgi:GAF domain-containing protein